MRKASNTSDKEMHELRWQFKFGSTLVRLGREMGRLLRWFAHPGVADPSVKRSRRHLAARKIGDVPYAPPFSRYAFGGNCL